MFSVQVVDLLRTSEGIDASVPDLAWIGVVFTQDGFKVPYLGFNVSYFEEDPDLHEKSQEAMDLVNRGEIDMAPVAITPEGLLVVLRPESTLNTAICSTLKLELLELKEDIGK